VASLLTYEQIKKLPKADLHVHLDGSLRLATLIELAKINKISLPSYTEAGLKETVFKDKYSSLVEYLQGFPLSCSVMQNREALFRIAYEFAWDCYAEGVLYVEPRYSPELFKGESALSTEDLIKSIDEGLQQAKKEINILIDKENRENKIKESSVLSKPFFEYSHIICAMRMWEPSVSLKTISEAIEVRDKFNLPIMAIDLAGPEEGFPAVDHKSAYVYAHEHFMYKTVHAGEAYGPASIFQAISQLYADRIGHGFHLFRQDMLNKKPEIAKRYVDNLVQFIAERRITIEVCLTSNLQTIPELEADMSKHSFLRMLENGLSVAICTDNRTVSNTSVSRELMLAQEAFKLNKKQMKKIIMYGIKRGFYSGTYLQKKAYIDACSKYYDFIDAQF
jgi:adenosine deaminase